MLLSGHPIGYRVATLSLTEVATNRSRLIRGVLPGTAFVLPFWLGVIAILYFW